MSYIKVVLTKEVLNLGKKGEVKEVKAGYARNFLIAKNMAVLLKSKESQALIAENVSQKKEILKKQKEKQAEIQSTIDKKIQFKVKVNKNNLPFKAIKAKDIAQKLKISEILVEVKPLKALGLHEALVGSGNTKSKVVVEILKEK